MPRVHVMSGAAHSVTVSSACYQPHDSSISHECDERWEKFTTLVCCNGFTVVWNKMQWETALVVGVVAWFFFPSCGVVELTWPLT